MEFLLGVCYYPEHWDKDIISKDISDIRKLGFNVIRTGEFAWSRFEPKEGEYDFSILHEVVMLCEKEGLKVILGTPTASMPKWLSDKYPEILCADSFGRRLGHGSRQHHNYTSLIYLSYVEKIVTAMAEAMKGYENIIGWQIDNEFGCHVLESYSEADDAAFGKWLEKKYKSIDELNRAWGTVFWSQEYSSFDVIECPRKTATYQNPSLLLDYYRFIADSIANYCQIQCDILRQMYPKAFMTHNGAFFGVDYEKLKESGLDFISYDSYPSFGERDEPQGGRKWSRKLTQVRGYSEKFMIMEQQSGPGGQLNYLLPSPEPGQVRLWTYQSIAHGAVGVIYFRWRTLHYGAEELWHGILEYDGKPNYRSREIGSVAEELERVGDLILKLKLKKDTAIIQDFDNEINSRKVEPFLADDISQFYTVLNDAHINVDILPNLDKIEQYSTVILPHYAISSEDDAKRLEKFAENGGRVIFGARCGIKDINNHYYRLTAPGVFSELAGAEISWYTTVPEHKKQQMLLNNKQIFVSQYYEVLEPQAAKTLATYTSGHSAGKAAIVKREVGKGTVYYIGTFFNEAISEFIADEIRGQSVKLPPEVEMLSYTGPDGEYRMLLNYSDKLQKLDTEKCFNLIDNSETNGVIPPYGVILHKI